MNVIPLKIISRVSKLSVVDKMSGKKQNEKTPQHLRSAGLPRVAGRVAELDPADVDEARAERREIDLLAVVGSARSGFLVLEKLLDLVDEVAV